MTEKQTTKQNWDAIQKAIQAKKAAKTKLETSPLTEAPAGLAVTPVALEPVQTTAPVAPTPAPVAPAPVAVAPTSTPVPSLVSVVESEEFKTLMAENKGLKHENGQLKTAATRLKTDVELKSASATEANKRAQTLKSALKEKESEVETLKAQVAELRKDLESALSDDSALNETEIADLRTQISNLTAQKKDLESQNAELVRDLQSALSESTESDSQAAHWTSVVSDKDGRINDLIAQNESLAARVAELTADLESALSQETPEPKVDLKQMAASLNTVMFDWLVRSTMPTEEKDKRFILETSVMSAEGKDKRYIFAAAKLLDPNDFSSVLNAFSKAFNAVTKSDEDSPYPKDLMAKANEILENQVLYDVLVVVSGLMNNDLTSAMEMLGDRFEPSVEKLNRAISAGEITDPEIVKAAQILKQYRD